jgi:hypothetical protein
MSADTWTGRCEECNGGVAHAPKCSRDRAPLRIRRGWQEAGKRGVRLGPDVYVGGQPWTPVLWDDEDDPTFHKAAGVEAAS